MKKQKKFLKQTGMAALLVVVIIGTATLIMATSISFIGLSALDTSYASNRGSEALALADTCAEEALRRLKINPSFLVENLTLPIGSESCIINIEDQGGQNRLITTLGRARDYEKKVSVYLTIIDSDINIISWKENSN